MPLPIVGIAPLNGWRQVGAPHWSYMEQHRFEASSKGELLHFTGADLRATVPPAGFADYCLAWPQAQPIVDAITRPAPKAAPKLSIDEAREALRAALERPNLIG